MVNTQASQTADPKRVADVTLAAAIRANADGVFIEPDEDDDAYYAITFERSNEVLTTVQVDATLGAAVTARLAYIAELDLAAASSSSSRLPVRSGTREAEVDNGIHAFEEMAIVFAILVDQVGDLDAGNFVALAVFGFYVEQGEFVALAQFGQNQ